MSAAPVLDSSLDAAAALVSEIRALRPTAAEPLPVVDLAALARAGVPAPVRICGDLLYRGHLHQLIGAPEAGKSTIAAAWALDVLRAGEAVIWIDEETGPEQMVEKLVALGATPDLLTRLTYVPFPGRTWGQADIDVLDELMTSTAPTLAVVDSVSAVMSAAGLNENDNTDASRIYKTVYLRMAREHGAAVVVLDHVAKSDEGGRYARGASSKLGLVDVSWRLDVIRRFSRTQDGVLKLVIGKDRRGYLHGTHELRVLTGGTLTVNITEVDSTAGAQDDAAEDTLAPAAGKLLDALRRRAEPATINQLVDTVAELHGHGLKRETASRNLSDLVKKGLAVSFDPERPGGPKRWAAVPVDSEDTAPPEEPIPPARAWTPTVLDGV